MTPSEHRALLGLALTSRDKGDDAVPMAGFPHPALETYLAKIVQAGLRAAVCEQVEDARLAKGLVKRDVVRIVSPGTLTDDELLDPKTANYLAAVVEDGPKLGLAWVELSTGRFSLTGLLRTELADEIARLNPSEILISELSLDAPWARLLRGQSWLLTTRPVVGLSARAGAKDAFRAFPDDNARRIRHRRSRNRGAGRRCAHGISARYPEIVAGSHRPADPLSPCRYSRARRDDPPQPRAGANLREGKREGSLLSVIDLSATPMGSRQLAEWLTSPLTSSESDPPAAGSRRRAAANSALRGDVRSLLGESYDLERLAARVGTGSATPRDLVALARTLAILPKLKARLTARTSKRLNQLEAALELCPEVRAEIEAALYDDPPLAVKEGGLIRDGYHPGLDELRESAKGGKSWIAKFQADQVRRTGIQSLKVGYNKVFGYYIEITHAQAQARGGDIPTDYIRKQTVKNAERYITRRAQGVRRARSVTPRTAPANLNTSSSPPCATGFRPKPPG